MIVNTDGRVEYKVTWQYGKEAGRAKTTCLLFKKKDDKFELVKEADALCSARDTFNKNYGRKLSLSRVLGKERGVGLPSDTRREFWCIYAKEIGLEGHR